MRCTRRRIQESVLPRLTCEEEQLRLRLDQAARRPATETISEEEMEFFSALPTG